MSHTLVGAGGWAIDLFLGRVTRAHHDVDLAILRDDQATVQRHLQGWSLQWVEPRAGGRFHPWQPGEQLAWPVHEIHGTHPHGATIELLLNEAEGDVWHFRRDRRIARSLSRVGLTTATGIPFLAPEVVLLYKAREGRDTDAADFAIVREALDGDQTAWLGQAIRIAYGAHPWLHLISRGGHSFSVETATSDWLGSYQSRLIEPRHRQLIKHVDAEGIEDKGLGDPQRQ